MIKYEVTVDARGTKWYVNDKLHREDGPAFRCTNGDNYWYRNGKLHREDGPAIEYANGNKYWYIDGKPLTEDQFNARCTGKTVVIDGVTYKLVVC